ncbi:Rv3235 family protein [Leifsonia sp. EB34]|uniref:Rv3235 family protein n=1 Tax=Leifsonia sp. EB34 TaxID=3156303 RepID=UPI00351778D6
MNALLSTVLERPAMERPNAARPPLRLVPPPRVAPTPVPAPPPDGPVFEPRTLDAELHAAGDDLRTDSGVGEDARLLCAKLALCVIEILAGARPLDQLGRWVSDSVFIQLLRRTVIAARSREVTGDEAKRPRVRVGEPLLNRLGDSVVEAVVMIHQPSRSRAVALRLERHRRRWRATAITVL